MAVFSVLPRIKPLKQTHPAYRHNPSMELCKSAKRKILLFLEIPCILCTVSHFFLRSVQFFPPPKKIQLRYLKYILYMSMCILWRMVGIIHYQLSINYQLMTLRGLRKPRKKGSGRSDTS